MEKDNKRIRGVFSALVLYALNTAVLAIDNVNVKTEYVPVALNKSKLVTLDKKSIIEEISQGNTQISGNNFKSDRESADTTFIKPNQILISGKSIGTTNLYLWGAKGKIIEILDIEVTHDLATLKAKLNELLPKERDVHGKPNISVHSSQKNIVLSGEVSTLAAMQSAIQLAQSYLGVSASLGGATPTSADGGQGNINVSTSAAQPKVDPSAGAVPQIINLMTVGGAQQVMLDVKVAEINRNVLKGLNIKFNAIQASNNFSIGAVNGGGTISSVGGGGALSPHSFDAGALFLQAISGQFMFNLSIDAANNQQLAKILAQPTLTTLSGQTATFVSGGEFPVPVPQSMGNGTAMVTIVFKEYGIGLKFVPVVLDSGRINLNLHVSVSELSTDAAVIAQAGSTNTQYSIPSLTKREASTTLELADGQTMSIAGLISEKVRENINKFPGLGDIPGLGALFRSSKFLKDTTELVIFVTPRLAQPVLATNVQFPTDSFVEPDDVDFYVLGRTDSRKARSRLADKSGHRVVTDGGLDGEFGQQIVGSAQ
jgi:pilus assembly protein CpaC